MGGHVDRPAQTLYILDGGDNPPCKRTNKASTALPSPRSTRGPARGDQGPCESIRFENTPTRRTRTARGGQRQRYMPSAEDHPRTATFYVVTSASA